MSGAVKIGRTMEKITQAVERLSAARKKIRILFAVYAALLLLVCVLLFFMREPALILGILAVIFYLFYVRPEMGRYQNMVSLENVRWSLFSGSSEMTPVKKPFTPDGVRAEKLFPVRDDKGALLCWHGFLTDRKNGKLTGAEVTFHFRDEENKRKNYCFMNGTVLRFDPERKDSLYDFLLVSDTLFPGNTAAEFYESAGYREQDSCPDSLKSRDLFVCEKCGHHLKTSFPGYRSGGRSKKPFFQGTGRKGRFSERPFFFYRLHSSEPARAVLRRETLPEGAAFCKIAEALSAS